MTTMSDRLRAKAAELHRKAEHLEATATYLDEEAGIHAKVSLNGKLRAAIGVRAQAERNGAVATPTTLKAFVAQHADWTAHPTPEVNRLMAAWQAAGHTTTRKSVAYSFREARRAAGDRSSVPTNDPIDAALRAALLEGPQRVSALVAHLAAQNLTLKKSSLRTRLMHLGARVKGRSRAASWSLPRSARA